MKFQALMTRVGAGSAALALFVFAGSTPAGAAVSDTIFTATSSEIVQGSIGTLDPAVPSFASLGTDLPAPYVANGIDLFGDTGYGILFDPDADQFFVTTWNRSTGAVTAPVLITQTIDDQLPISAVLAADTLADGTLISFLGLDDGNGGLEYVVSIDPVTGVATELVDITAAAGFLDGLATDPTTGITYAFVDGDIGIQQFLVLDLVGGTYTGPTDLTAVQSALGDLYFGEADFNSSGTLYFYFNEFSGSALRVGVTSGAFSATVGATAVSTAVSSGVDDDNLTVTPAPALANTGLSIEGLLAGGVALLGAGLAAVFVTRRRAAA